MNLTIHRGSHEIGGTCVEVRGGDSRIILDIGMPLVGADKKEKFDFRPFEKMSGRALVKKGILPDVKGLYAWDKCSKPIDGLLISHAHMDHYGFLRYIREDLCVYMGRPTHRLIDLTCAFTSMEASVGQHKYFKSGKPFRCGAFRITPYLMDHSAFDAHAFTIEATGKTLVYTGDFREHGRKKKAFEFFLAKAPRKADALMIEGSMLGRDSERTPTETQIELAIAPILKATPGIALTHVSSQNIDRLVTFYRACIRSDRLFCVDFYTANVLADLRKSSGAELPYPSKSYDLFRVFYPKFLSDRVVKEGKKHLMNRVARYKITPTEMAENQHKVMMLARPSTIWDLNAMHRKRPLTNGILIYSLWSGYLEEAYTQKLIDWAKAHEMNTHTFHTSGHAHVGTLKKVVNWLMPQRIIPIHTFYPERYQELYGDCVVMVPDRKEAAL